MRPNAALVFAASFVFCFGLPANSPAQNRVPAGQCVISGGTISGTVKQDCSVNVYGVGLPTLTIVSRSEVENKDKTYTTTIVFDVEGQIAPGRVTVRADTQALVDADIMPVTTAQFSSMQMNNVMQGPTVYIATIPAPFGKYQMTLKTTSKSPPVTFSYTFQ
jgi:hypothetical protein